MQGHPDSQTKHYCHALVEKYSSAAIAAKHEVRETVIAKLEFPLLSSQAEFEKGELCPDIKQAQKDIAWADHLVLIYPLWLGDMPALVKGFCEQVFRPGFALSEVRQDDMYKKLLKGKSARIFVTMGMPAFVYRWFFKAHTVKSLKRNILSFCGFNPVGISLIGQVHEGKEDHLRDELSKAAHLGNIAE